LHRTLEGLEANDLAKVGEDEDDIEGEEVQDDEDGEKNGKRGGEAVETMLDEVYRSETRAHAQNETKRKLEGGG
jgi:hypothetical protein